MAKENFVTKRVTRQSIVVCSYPTSPARKKKRATSFVLFEVDGFKWPPAGETVFGTGILLRWHPSLARFQHTATRHNLRQFATFCVRLCWRRRTKQEIERELFHGNDLKFNHIQTFHYCKESQFTHLLATRVSSEQWRHYETLSRSHVELIQKQKQVITASFLSLFLPFSFISNKRIYNYTYIYGHIIVWFLEGKDPRPSLPRYSRS